MGTGGECAGEMEESWSVGVFDAHCHPTDIMASVDRISAMLARCLTVMSTRSQDQELVYNAAELYPVSDKAELQNPSTRSKVIPAFGWHPWFSHQLVDDRAGTYIENDGVGKMAHYSKVLTPTPDEDFISCLAEPQSLTEFLSETERRLLKFPLALVGEVGIDRSFRLPRGPSSVTGDVSMKTGGDEGAYTPGSREGRPLTPYKVQMEHQKLVLKAQLELAAKLGRAVSVHSVQAHGVVYEELASLWKGHELPSKNKLKKQRNDPVAIDEALEQTDGREEHRRPPFPPRICMHSYSGPRDALRQFLDHTIPAAIYFSFSECINFSTPASKKAEEVISQVPDDRILIESDLHCAGDKMDELLAGILHRICKIKGWDPVQGSKILRSNWERFIFG